MRPSKHKKMKFKSVHIADISKVTEIRDAFGNLKFKVVMSSTEENKVKHYELQVYNCFSKDEPFVISSRPEDGEDPITDFKFASEIFDEFVVNYSCLVKAETKDMRDIDIFKEKIEYRETCPECCGTCKWSSLHCHPDWKKPVFEQHLRCSNPENVKEFRFDFDVKHCEDDIHMSHFIGEIPKRCESYHDEDQVHPKVKVFGVCKHYEKNERLEDR